MNFVNDSSGERESEQKEAVTDQEDPLSVGYSSLDLMNCAGCVCSVRAVDSGLEHVMVADGW